MLLMPRDLVFQFGIFHYDFWGRQLALKLVLGE